MQKSQSPVDLQQTVTDPDLFCNHLLVFLQAANKKKKQLNLSPIVQDEQLNPPYLDTIYFSSAELKLDTTSLFSVCTRLTYETLTDRHTSCIAGVQMEK